MQLLIGMTRCIRIALAPHVKDLFNETVAFEQVAALGADGVAPHRGKRESG